jgi:chemotaxis protein MotB
MRAKAARGRGDRKAGGLVIRRQEVASTHAPHGGAWKVAYADFVTAMMAFFLVMWLMNATTEDQRKGLADYFSPSSLMSHNSSGTGQPFGGHTAFDDGAMISDRGALQITVGSRPVLDNVDDDVDTPGTTPPRSGPDQSPPRATESRPVQPGSGVAVLPPTTPPSGALHPAGAARAALVSLSDKAVSSDHAAERAKQEQHAFNSAAEQIREAVRNDPALASLAAHLAIDVTPEGLRIQLLDSQNQSMFALGSAEPNEAARMLIAKITPVLLRLPEQISISGHTDAAPYPGPTMTNWELSEQRANAARRLLVAAGLPEQRLRDVAGHADHELLLPADPLAAANRRIAIVVLRGTTSTRSPGPAATQTGAAAAGGPATTG